MNNFDLNQTLEVIQKEVEAFSPKNINKLLEKLNSIATKESLYSKYLPPTILNAVETIVNNKGENKYIFSILITAAVKKIISPNQDIRIAQENMANGYSNRSLDQRFITPFLKRYGYTHCEASGLESGRNLERPLSWNLKYPCNPRGRGNREAFLGILNYIENENGDPAEIVKYLLYYDKLKQASVELTTTPPLEVKIRKIMNILERHFKESSGQGKSRLPVLALYSIYSLLIKELSRFKEAELLNLERHTTADLRSGSIGDIQVNKNGAPFEGVEVKSEKTITASMINELPRKFNGKPVARYYILSTSIPNIIPDDEESVKTSVENVEQQTGCQVIVNGLIKTLWYYLRLLDDPSPILIIYQNLLENDEDVRSELKVVWNKIVSEEYPSLR